jgi:hypothetical protein
MFRAAKTAAIAGALTASALTFLAAPAEAVTDYPQLRPYAPDLRARCGAV